MQSFFQVYALPSLSSRRHKVLGDVIVTSVTCVQVLYERILPSSDPALAAKYDRLQQAAQAVFQGGCQNVSSVFW